MFMYLNFLESELNKSIQIKGPVHTSSIQWINVPNRVKLQAQSHGEAVTVLFPLSYLAKLLKKHSS